MSPPLNLVANRKSRAWCWTLHNYTDNDLASLKLRGTLTYLMYGHEVGEAGETPHLQGLAYFKHPIRMASVKAHLKAPRAHLEVMKGTVAQSVVYCSKEGGIFQEYGVRPLDQAAKGLKGAEKYREALELAKAGDFEAICPKLRTVHYNTYKRVRMDFLLAQGMNLLPLHHEQKMHWFHGPSGSGKTVRARVDYPDAYLKSGSNKWWDGYDGQEVVIVEDFDTRNEHMVFLLKEWLDIHPFMAEVKGSSIVIRPKLVVVTSNYHPADIWTKVQDSGPITRRLVITRMEVEDFVPPPPDPRIVPWVYVHPRDRVAAAAPPPPRPSGPRRRCRRRLRFGDGAHGGSTERDGWFSGIGSDRFDYGITDLFF